MIKVLVGCTILNLLMGLLSYLTLEVHKWQVLILVSLINVIVLGYELIVILRQKAVDNKILGVGFARNVFFIAAIFSMKFYLDINFGIFFFVVALGSSFLVFRRVITKGEAFILSILNAGALVTALSLIPWKISESKVSSQQVQKYPGQSVLRSFDRYAGQVGIKIEGNEQRFNTASLKPELTLIKVENIIGGTAYFLE